MIFYHYYLRPNSTIHTCNSSHQLDRAYVEELKLQELINRGIFDRFPEIYEHEFILHYYMQMCYVLFIQFDIIQYDTIRMLHDNTYKRFPNYKNNLFVNTNFWDGCRVKETGYAGVMADYALGLEIGKEVIKNGEYIIFA